MGRRPMQDCRLWGHGNPGVGGCRGAVDDEGVTLCLPRREEDRCRRVGREVREALPFEGPTRSMPSTHVGSTVTALTRPSPAVVRRYPAPKSASACSKRSRSTAMLMDSP